MLEVASNRAYYIQRYRQDLIAVKRLSTQTVTVSPAEPPRGLVPPVTMETHDGAVQFWSRVILAPAMPFRSVTHWGQRLPFKATKSAMLTHAVQLPQVEGLSGVQSEPET